MFAVIITIEVAETILENSSLTHEASTAIGEATLTWTVGVDASTSPAQLLKTYF